MKAVKNIDKHFRFISLKDSDEKHIKFRIKVFSKNRFGLLGDISGVIYKYANEMTYMKAFTSKDLDYAYFVMDVVVDKIETVEQIFEELEQFDDIYVVTPSLSKGIKWFYMIAIFTAVIWGVHPFFMSLVLNSEIVTNNYIIAYFMLFLGIFALMFMLFYLNWILKKYFPVVRNKNLPWIIAFLIINLAVLAVFFELRYFNFDFAEIFSAIILVGAYIYFGINYFKYRK